MSNRLDQIEGLFPPLLQKYAGLAGRAKISLAVGQPEMPPPPEIVEVVREFSLNPVHARYTPAGGRSDLLVEVAAHFATLGFADKNPDNFLVSHGAKLLIDVALRALGNPGDRVIWFGPGYTYGRTAQLNGFESVIIRCLPPDFNPDLEVLESQLLAAEAAHKSAVVIINNPVNPTGRVWGSDVLDALADILSCHGVSVIADETYAGLAYTPEALAAQPFALNSKLNESSVVTIRSGSKGMCIPGYRLGLAHGPQRIISAMRSILGDCVGCPNTLTQEVAYRTLSQYSEFCQRQLEPLKEKRQLVTNWCLQHNLQVAPMDGAFYAFVNFAPLPGHLQLDNSCALADLFLEKLGVGVIPGCAFGERLTDFSQWVRISYAGPRVDLQEGLKHISELFD